jgi:ABC-type multidrug transport system fused ATPase/permease subunit
MIIQSAVGSVKAEYKALGMNTNKIQNDYISSTGIVMLLKALLSAVCTIIVGLLSAIIAAGLSRNLRRGIFSKVESFSNAEFDQFSTASLITRTTNDITQIQTLIVMAFLMLSIMFIMIPRASVSAQRIADVLEVKTVIVDPENPKVFDKNKKGELEFKNVSFRYPGAEEDAIKNISFKAIPNQTTAIIGSTGAGKTTLINLIPRFYDVTDGAIFLDGVNVRDVTQHELHDKIGYVPQKGILFSGTIESNLRYADESASEEVMETCQSYQEIALSQFSKEELA